MLPTLYPREKRILWVTAAVLIAALCYLFLLDPFFREWRTLSSRIQLAQGKLQRTRLLLKRKSEIEAAYQALTGGSTDRSKAPESVVTQMLQEVEDLAQKSGLNILELRPLPGRKKGFFQEQGLELSAEGTAPQFARFIYSLFESPNPLKIEKLELRSKSGGDPSLRGILVLSTLLQSP